MSRSDNLSTATHTGLIATLYDTIEEFNVDSKAEYSALSSTRFVGQD